MPVTLADPKIRTHFLERLARLAPDSPRRWGRMTAHQMVCHLNDSFRAGTGDKHVSPASNLFSRTVMKWVALRTPLPWPRGVPTRPEIDQRVAGTPPRDWSRDCAELRELVVSFPDGQFAPKHPIFGEMTPEEWNMWAYRHTDHHLRQFGV
jgi:hypothetical protein